MSEVNKDTLIDALDSVTWYNGLAEFVLRWKEDGYLQNYDNYALSLPWEMTSDHDQLEVIWMICVNLFGDYGTSPRSGWIEYKNRKEFNQFIDDITQTYREYKEYKEYKEYNESKKEEHENGLEKGEADGQGDR